MDGHESTGAVIKYVDDYLYTNINNLYEKGLLKDTVIFFLVIMDYIFQQFFLF